MLQLQTGKEKINVSIILNWLHHVQYCLLMSSTNYKTTNKWSGIGSPPWTILGGDPPKGSETP